MYASRTTQFLVGVFALAGLLALAFLSFRLGRLELFAPPGYLLYANFDNVSGLKDGDNVEIAGVAVGKVLSISLKQERANVKMRIDRTVPDRRRRDRGGADARHNWRQVYRGLAWQRP